MFESHGDPAAVSRGIKAHTNILRAIQKRDPAAARRAMAVHLQESRQSFPEQVVKRPGAPGPRAVPARQGQPRSR
jgi:DNA-binding GntR family transcriptional regulator